LINKSELTDALNTFRKLSKENNNLVYKSFPDCYSIEFDHEAYVFVEK